MEIEGLDDLHANMPAHDASDIGTQAEDILNSESEEQNVQDTEDKDYTIDDYRKVDQNLDEETPVTEEKPEDTSKLSGIEQYLAQFNIEGGMIDFQDGTRAHFNELDADKQLDVLSKLHSSTAQGVEEKYGLDEEEIGLINYMRQQEGTIDEVIDRLAQQRAQTYIMSQNVASADVKAMNADEVYTAFLLKSNPEATTEQLEQDLETAKKMSNFNNIVTSLKSEMLKEQTAQIEQRKHASTQELYAEIEDQRKQVVSAVSKIDSIDGLTINDGIKNDVLDLILNVDDDGDSLFMTEVFSNPEKLFRAAFWYKNATDILDARETYWKKEKSAAYKRGLAEAQSGRKSFNAEDVVGSNKTTPHHSEPNEMVSFDDLY
jgi:hypothetical protein